jgi:hypothetical protein|tara:strand:+ start:382 stop:504 length:123 start_codon:yes stop_codon:yes gene_type:complete
MLACDLFFVVLGFSQGFYSAKYCLAMLADSVKKINFRGKS